MDEKIGSNLQHNSGSLKEVHWMKWYWLMNWCYSGAKLTQMKWGQNKSTSSSNVFEIFGMIFSLRKEQWTNRDYICILNILCVFVFFFLHHWSDSWFLLGWDWTRPMFKNRHTRTFQSVNKNIGRLLEPGIVKEKITRPFGSLSWSWLWNFESIPLYPCRFI